MARYHIKASGEPGICTAKPGACPLGGEHFHNEDEARAHFEASQVSFGAVTMRARAAVRMDRSQALANLAGNGTTLEVLAARQRARAAYMTPAKREGFSRSMRAGAEAFA